MTRPLALDLFCCSGGSTVGLERAGFDVIGIDHKPSQHWCGAGELHEADLSTADAVESVIRAFAPDFVSASPPCQANSVATAKHTRERHANLIASTREGMVRTGVPGWIENVPPIARIRWPELVRPDVVLCGSMFPETPRLRRHRHFELIEWYVFTPPHWNCTFEPISVAGKGPPDRHQAARYKARRAVITATGNGPTGGADRNGFVGQNRPGPECIRWREAMGWLDGPRDRYSLAQAIPPAYAEWLGRRFLETREAVRRTEGT